VGRVTCDLGYLPRYCGAFLEGLATTLPDPARVVEIGTASGCSLVAILQGLSLHRDAHVWTIDVQNCIGADMMVREAGLDVSRYTRLVAESRKTVEGWKVPLNMIYIDGGHEYSDVKTDIVSWSPHLVPGGILAFDDYDNLPTPGVRQAVDEMMTEDQWFLIGSVGRLIAFEKRSEGPLSWYRDIGWLSEEERNGRISPRLWKYLSLGFIWPGWGS